MGIARGAVALLLDEARQRPFTGRLATLGRQTIGATAKEIEGEFRRFGAAPPPAQPCDDVALFKQLGFASVDSFDYSTFEGANHTIDLNQRSSLPDHHVAAFDVMLDSGTVEHVFDIAAALVNAVSMVKVGGRAIFLSPASNYMNHGFYSLAPGLFFDFFSANGWRIENIKVVRHTGELRGRFRTYAYTPASASFLPSGAGTSLFLVLAVATRLPASTTDRIPQQGMYIRAWEGQIASRSPRRQRIIDALEWIPGATRLAFPVWNAACGMYYRHQQRRGNF